MVDIIKEEHCREILLKHNQTFEFNSFEVKRLVQESLGGLIGLHYILKIVYKHNQNPKTLQLFVKTLNDHNKLMFKVSKSLLFYEKEKLYFMDLLPEYERVGINAAFAPRGFYCGDNAIVLEDLTLGGYKLFPKERPMDIEHCYACLSTLAKFHASSMLFEICKTKSSGKKYNLLEEHSSVLEDLIYSGGDTYGAKYIEESVNGLLALAELEFDDKTCLQQLKHIFSSSGSANYENLCCVLLHGDLWSNNFLHKYDDKNRIFDSKLIDFQTIKYGPPCLDVLQLIHTNTKISLRNDYFVEMLSFYYKNLDEIFSERAINLSDYLPRDQFFASCRKFEIQIKLQSVIDRCLTAISDREFEEISSDEDRFYDFLFVNRSKYLISYYLNIPNYKKMVSEDLKELKDLLEISELKGMDHHDPTSTWTIQEHHLI